MGRIFISAAHGGQESGVTDPGAVIAGTTEAREMILTRDLVVTELRSRSFEILSVPDDLSARQTLDWINGRSRTGDIALEIHTDAFSNPSVRGSAVFYISNNAQRKAQAETLLLALLRRVPQLPNRGARPDTATGLGSLAFCRQLVVPALLMEVAVLSNPDDRFIIQNQRRNVALGIADGLASWSRSVSPPTSTPNPTPSPLTYPPCNININGQTYGEQGIIISGNAYVPIDLVDRLGADVSTDPNVRRITYRNIVYVRAVDLRDRHISIAWDSTNRTIFLKSASRLCSGQFDKIAGQGNTSEVQLLMFLKANNEAALTRYPEIAKLYREEGSIEGINYDIAFAQMCLETDFLRFSGTVRPEQNNFGGLGSAGGDSQGASFPSARIGVRAQIQHLKAYANAEPLVQAVVDPRFNFVARGVAPLVSLLSGRWAADPQYGDKLLAVLKRLYESAGLM
jgi:hypothetical protein